MTTTRRRRRSRGGGGGEGGGEEGGEGRGGGEGGGGGGEGDEEEEEEEGGGNIDQVLCACSSTCMYLSHENGTVLQSNLYSVYMAHYRTFLQTNSVMCIKNIKKK